MKIRFLHFLFFIICQFGCPPLVSASSECERQLRTHPLAPLTPHFTLQDLKFVKDESILIPIIGDVHGDLTRFLKLIANLQIKYQVKFPWVLQVGDFGINQDPQGFPRWPGKNVDEINRAYSGDDSVINRYFNTSPRLMDLETNIVFIRGNHDFMLEETLASPHLVQVMSHTFLLPDGQIQQIELIPGETVRLAALGGIDETNFISHRPPHERYNIGISSSAMKQLNAEGKDIDILLTHQGPDFEYKGSSLINQLIVNLKPLFHFHGHSHEVRNIVNKIHQTHTHALANLPDRDLHLDDLTPEYPSPAWPLRTSRCSPTSCYALLRYDLITKALILLQE